MLFPMQRVMGEVGEGVTGSSVLRQGAPPPIVEGGALLVWRGQMPDTLSASVGTCGAKFLANLGSAHSGGRENGLLPVFHWTAVRGSLRGSDSRRHLGFYCRCRCESATRNTGAAHLAERFCRGPGCYSGCTQRVHNPRPTSVPLVSRPAVYGRTPVTMAGCPKIEKEAVKESRRFAQESPAHLFRDGDTG